MAFNFGYPMNPPREPLLLPGVPTDLTVVYESDTTVRATWNAPIDGDTTATDYDVYSYDGLITRSRGFLTLVVDAPPNVAVDYKVRSTDVDGYNSAWTDVVTYTNEVIAVGIDFFVTNDGAGTKDGLTIANAMGVTEHNSYAFSAGVTIALSGIFTSQLNITRSGTVGNHIVYDGNDGVNTPCDFQTLHEYGRHSIVCPDGADLGFLTFQNIECSSGNKAFNFYPNTMESVYFYNNNLHDLLTSGIWISSNQGGVYSAISDVVIGGSPENANRLYNIGTGTAGGDIIISNCDDLVISHNVCSADKGTGATTDIGVDGVVLFYCQDYLIEYNDLTNHWDMYSPDPLLPADYNVWQGENEATQNVNIVTGDIVGYSYVGDPKIEEPVRGAIKNRYQALSDFGTIDLNTEDFTVTANWTDLGRGEYALEGTGEDGIDLKDENRNGIVRYNDLSHNRQTGVTAQMGTSGVEIYGNYIEGCYWAGTACYYGANGTFTAVTDIDIHHNIFLENYGIGAQVNAEGADNIKINNNVFVRNGLIPRGKTDSGIQVFTATNSSVQNNIFYDNRPDEVGSERYQINVAGGSVDYATLILDNNLYYDSTQANSYARYGEAIELVLVNTVETDPLETDPIFVNPASNFVLQVGSPALGQATDLGYTTDYDEVTIIPPDNLGAYTEPEEPAEPWNSLSPVVPETAGFDDEIGTYTKLTDISFDLDVTTAGTSISNPNVLVATDDFGTGTECRLTFDATYSIDGDNVQPQLYRINAGSVENIQYEIVQGANEILFTGQGPSQLWIFLYFRGTRIFNLSITNLKVEEKV